VNRKSSTEEKQDPKTESVKADSSWPVVEIMIFLGFLAGILYGLSFVIKPLWKIGTQVAQDIPPTVAITSSITITLGLSLTYSIRYLVQMRSQAENRAKRAKVYESIIHFYIETMLWEKLGQEPKTEQEIAEFYAAITPKMITCASNRVIKQYARLREWSFKQATNPDPSFFTHIESLFEFESLFLAMREDLGYPAKDLKKGEILSLFVNDVYHSLGSPTQS
jgi:hypothetical protein